MNKRIKNFKSYVKMNENEEYDFDEEKDLEFVDGGDGVEYELWKNKNTGILYRVPIEIVRYFDEKTETNSAYSAKYGD